LCEIIWMPDGAVAVSIYKTSLWNQKIDALENPLLEYYFSEKFSDVQNALGSAEISPVEA
jgi:hypothetical protein